MRAKAAWVLCAGFGLAETALADSVERIERIEVTGHYENAVGTSDAASQGVITRRLIEDRPLLRPFRGDF